MKLHGQAMSDNLRKEPPGMKQTRWQNNSLFFCTFFAKVKNILNGVGLDI